MTSPKSKSHMEQIVLARPKKKIPSSKTLDMKPTLRDKDESWGRTTALVDGPNTMISARSAKLSVCPTLMLKYIRQRSHRIVGSFYYFQSKISPKYIEFRIAKKWQESSWHILRKEYDVDQFLMAMMRRMAPISDTIIILSGDSDYKAHREVYHHELGKRIIFAGFARNTADSIRQECEWINLENIGVCKPSTKEN